MRRIRVWWLRVAFFTSTVSSGCSSSISGCSSSEPIASEGRVGHVSEGFIPIEGRVEHVPEGFVPVVLLTQSNTPLVPIFSYCGHFSADAYKLIDLPGAPSGSFRVRPARAPCDVTLILVSEKTVAYRSWSLESASKAKPLVLDASIVGPAHPWSKDDHKMLFDVHRLVVAACLHRAGSQALCEGPAREQASRMLPHSWGGPE